MSATTSQWLHRYQQQLLSLTETLEEWGRQPVALLNQAPQPGKWSALQCADHLSQYFDWYLPALQKKLGNTRTENRSDKPYHSGWLGGYFIRLMEPGSKPMKSPKDKVPAAGTTLSIAVLQKLNAQCRQFNELITQAYAADINRRMGISLSPVIRMKTGDVIAFLTAHLQRHILQGQKAIEQAKQTFQPIKKESYAAVS